MIIYPVAKALAIFGPIAILATVLLNVFEATRLVTLVTVLSVIGAGAAYCASIEAPRGNR